MFNTIPLLLLLVTNNGCVGSTIYSEIGADVCLDFLKNNSFQTYAIKKKNDPYCISYDGKNTEMFSNVVGNKSVNCSISQSMMSICIGKFQSDDAGTFSLRNGLTSDSFLLKNIKLIKATPVMYVNVTQTSITVLEGQPINLTCISSRSEPPANITWYMSSKNITTSFTFINDSLNDTVRTLSSLQTDVDRSDNGKRVNCTASNMPGRSVSSSILIIVQYKPTVSSYPPSPYNIPEKMTAYINCTIKDANPKINILWLWSVNGNDVDVPLSNYTIPNIQRNMSGTYSCKAKNSAGTSLAASTFVDVQYVPEVTARFQSSSRVIEGETTILECVLIVANPNTVISWQWFKTDNHMDLLHNDSIYTIPNIMRSNSGSYSCTAENSIGTSKLATVSIDVLYKPDVEARTPSPYKVIEGKNATLECIVTSANPATIITWNWYKNDVATDLSQNGPTYIIAGIGRSKSGFYSCKASNTVGESLAANITIDVQFKPQIADKGRTIVNESAEILLSRDITSNPLSNVTWFNGSILLKSQYSVPTATYTKRNATCTDTTNLTLIASNGVEGNVTAFVELIVNCKPQLYVTNITLGVTDSTGIEFSTTFIAYPGPWYELEYENGTKNTKIKSRITNKAVNIFTINFNEAGVTQEDYGTYYLRVGNIFGNGTIIVNVLPQQKPTEPKVIQVDCEETRAAVKWKSSFNGGDSQTFTAFAIDSQRKPSGSVTIYDKGENEIHSTYVNNLQPSVSYVFYVSAKNRHGSSSSANISCTTLQESSKSVPLIAGGAAAGGIALSIIAIVIVVLLRKYTKHEKGAGESQRFENEVIEKEADDDGMKDNILYVSAGPKVDEKPEAAVYAAVNKKAPESNNNANMYAEVNKGGHLIAEGALYSDVKPKRGLFKKDVGRKRDGKPKQKKGKKQKSKQDVADVYENSEDIAMSSKSDNVYSNTGQKVQNKEERGYKNKDGLLYVEVQFDTKNEKGNQTIHGEDEKTDYATVEFPMAASTHDESGNEKI